MTAAVQSPEDVVNVALAQIGYKLRVNALFDGTPASAKALDIYAQTRDAMLRTADWHFSEKIAAPAFSGSVAPLPWVAEYQYPNDCIRLRNVILQAYLDNTNNPLPVLWQVASSVHAGLQIKVIWTKFVAVSLVYTQQVTNPANWEPLFVAALATELGKHLVPVLLDHDAKAEMEQEKIIIPLAASVVG